MSLFEHAVADYSRLLGVCLRDGATPAKLTRLTSHLLRLARPSDAREWRASAQCVEAALCFVPRALAKPPHAAPVAAFLRTLLDVFARTLAASPSALREAESAVRAVLARRVALNFVAQVRARGRASAALCVLRAAAPGETRPEALAALLSLFELRESDWPDALGLTAKFLFDEIAARDRLAALEALAPVLDRVPSRAVFVDSLRAAFDAATDCEEQILTLKCLTVLVAAGPYEFEAYYPALYALLQRDADNGLFAARHVRTFCAVLEASLRSDRLPTAVCCSFAKLLLRKSLAASARTALFLAFLLFNLFKASEQLRAFLRKDGAPADDGFAAAAPLGANGIEQSSLWEARLLRRHAVPAVAAAFAALAHTEHADFLELSACLAAESARFLAARLDAFKVAAL